MKLVIQRVKHASCTIEGEMVSRIDKGFMVLVGFGEGDNEEVAMKLANKLIKPHPHCGKRTRSRGG